MSAPKHVLALVGVVVALGLCNGLQGSIDLYRHYPAPVCPLQEKHQHGPDVRGCEKWGEGYGPRMDWLQAMRRFHTLTGEGWDLEAFSVVIIGGIMGGFRQVATTILWMKSDEYWHQGKANRMIPILRAVTWLDPNFLDGWRIAGWHWAYNLYVEARNFAEKEMALQNGLNFLKEGIVWNPNSSELHFELAWTYYDKAGNFQEAVKWFGEAREKPDYRKNYRIDTAQHMRAHAYERIPEIDGALKAYGVILDLTPEEEKALDLWIEFKRRYRATRKLVSLYNAFRPVVPSPEDLPPDMPEGMRESMPPPPPPPKAGTKYFPECNHLRRPDWTEADIRRQMPDIERWKDWKEFDAVAVAYQEAKKKGDAATMSLIKARIPDIERAMAVFPIVRKIETREPPAPGATITIRMRYLEAWKLFKANRYEEARQALMESMQLEPEDASFPIGHHLLAHIYKAQYDATGKREFLEKAYYEGWLESARHNQMNRLAHAQVHAYQVQYGLPEVDVKKPREEVPSEIPRPREGPPQHRLTD